MGLFHMGQTMEDIFDITDGVFPRFLGARTRAAAAQLPESAAPVITQQPTPVNGEAYIGDQVTFSIKATGASLAYQWQTSDDQGATWRNTDGTGTDTDTVKTVPLTKVNPDELHRCVVTNTDPGHRPKTIESAAAHTHVYAALKWTKQPDNDAIVGEDVVGEWTGGKPPYNGEITGPNNVLLNIQDGNATSLTLNVDGTNQPIGRYAWAVRDKNNREINGSTTVKPAFYVAFRQNTAATTAPQMTYPFAFFGEGFQALNWTEADGPITVIASKYKSETTAPVSYGTQGCTFTSSNNAVAVVTRAGNDYTFTINPAGTGQAKLIVTTASGDAVGTLTINIS